MTAEQAVETIARAVQVLQTEKQALFSFLELNALSIAIKVLSEKQQALKAVK